MEKDYIDDCANTSIVEVVWQDHVIYSTPNWRDVTDELKPATIKSVGYVVRDMPEYLELVETIDVEQPIAGNHRVILKSTISSIKVLHGT